MDFSGATGSQYFGLLNSSTDGAPSNHLLAVEFDTIQNPEFFDISDNHVGIDVNRLKSAASANISYNNRSFRLINGQALQVWVDFDSMDQLVKVYLAPMAKAKPLLPLVSAVVNFSSVFLDTMYVGFSATTGPMVSSCYVLGWSFSISGAAPSLNLKRLPSLPKDPSPPRKLISEVGIPVVTVFFIGSMVGGTLFFVRKKKYEEILEDWEREYGTRRFCYRDLYKATGGFASERLLGFGGFGHVYRGVLPLSKKEVAVKKVCDDSQARMKQFVAEIATIGRLRHRNLVQLLGYCRRRGELLLVYDYMPNKSLDQYLFSSLEQLSLPWAERLWVIRGVAGFCASLSPRGMGEGGSSQRRQIQQRPPRRRHERKVGRLWACQTLRSRVAAPNHPHRWHHRLPGAGVHKDRQGHHCHRRLLVKLQRKR